MKANEGKSMADVVALIAKQIDVTEANAKSYYKWIVANGKAPGAVEKTARAAKSATPKAPKAKAPKIIKAKPVKLTDKPKITDKTVEEIADIRAKNLARLKAVHKKYAKGQYAEGKSGGFTADQAADAQQYVADVTSDLDSFKAPEFLSMDQVKALV
jgi:hypothetical protein